MPVATPFFDIKLTKTEYDALLAKTGTEGAAVAKARRDPQIEFRDATYNVRIGYDYRTMVSLHTPFRRWVKMKTLTEAMESATDTFKQLIDKRIADARDKCRATFDPATFVEPPQPVIDAEATGNAAAAQILAAAPGFAVGRGHGDAPSADAMMALLTGEGKAVDMLFIEEFRIDAQQEMDDYLSGPNEVEMGPKLKQRVAELKSNYNVDWEPVLFKAKQKKIKVYGIDTPEAEPGVESNDPRYGERRVAVMNTIAADVVKKAQKDNPGAKFVLVCGDAHLNTHPGGVPGLAQMLGVPGIHVDPKGRLRVAPDDKSERGMPPAAHQKFIDDGMAKAVAEYEKLPADTRKPSRLNDEEVRRLMGTLAKRHAAAGRLGGGGGLGGHREVSAALAHKDTTDAIAALIKSTQGRDARKPLLETAITAGDLAEVKKLLTADPGLAFNKDTLPDATTALHLAARLGHEDIVALLLAGGADPNVLNEKGLSPVHEACGAAVDGKRAAAVLETLTDAGGDLSVPDPACRTGYGIALGRPDTELLGAMVESGNGKIEDLYVRVFENRAREEYADAGRDPTLHEDFNAGELRALAKQRFKTMSALTRIADANDITEVMNVDDESDAQIRQLIVATKGRRQRRTDIRTAVLAGDVAAVGKHLDADPLFGTLELENDQTALTLAAMKDQQAVVSAMLAKGVDPNHMSSVGRTTLHELCGAERPKSDTAQHAKFASTANLLIEGGANVNVRNRRGQTPLHLAGFRNNAAMVQKLADAGADPSVKDSRGWTAYDMTMGSTNKEAEAVFHTNKLATKAAPVAPGKHSTVDLLCMATLCNDPVKDDLKVRKMYEKLYAEASLRPVLDLAAAASCNDRDPPKGGLRIFANDSKTVGPLYGQSVGPSGAYDEKVNTLLMPTLTDPTEKDAIGTVIHELTHMTAHLVTDDEDAIPYVDDQQKQRYLAAINEDMKRLHQLNDADPAHAFIKNRIGGRMTSDGYASKKTGETDFTEADKRLLQEYVVGVPQLIASYGMDYVREHVPNLAGYYEELARQASQLVATDPRFVKGRAALDTGKNTALVQRLDAEAVKPKAPAKEMISKDGAGVGVDEIVDKLRLEYIAQFGRQKAPKPGGLTMVASADDFEMNPKDQASVEKRLALVKKVLKTTLRAGQLPPKLSSEALKPLLTTLGKALHDAPGDKELMKTATLTSDNWTKKAKIDYVQSRIDGKHDLTATDLAEAAVLKAEMRARGANPDDDSWVTAAFDTSQSRQKTAVKNLAAELEKPEHKDRLARPAELIDRLATSLSAPGSEAIRVKTKPKRVGRRDPRHVSISNSNAKKAWVLALKGMPLR